jgi:hypothetical protein
MMNHDPFQTYQTTGLYSTGVSPYGLPYGASQQPFINPAALATHPLANSPFGGYGINPQQLQGAFGAGQNPIWQNPLLQNSQFQNPQMQNPQFQAAYLQTPQLQNPILQNPVLQNPLVQHALLQNHLQQLAWQTQLLNQAQAWPQQQQFGGYQLAPQGPIGGGIGQGVGFGQPFGQIHPLAHLAMRQAVGGGISPYGGAF